MPSPHTPDPATPCPDTLAVLDSAAALALMDHNTALYRDIAQSYLQELDALLLTLPARLWQPPAADCLHTLHSFKGLSLTVGAYRLAEACRACEAALKRQLAHGQTDDAAQASLQAQLMGSMAQTRLALLALLGGPASAAPLAPAR